jgi:hypothetical protein
MHVEHMLQARASLIVLGKPDAFSPAITHCIAPTVTTSALIPLQ